MEGIINVRVNGHSIVKDNNCAGAQFEVGSKKMRIEFSEDWDGFAKTVTFWNALGNDPVEVILTTDLLEDITQSERVYLVPIAGEAMTKAGMLPFAIDGYKKYEDQDGRVETIASNGLGGPITILFDESDAAVILEQSKANVIGFADLYCEGSLTDLPETSIEFYDNLSPVRIDREYGGKKIIRLELLDCRAEGEIKVIHKRSNGVRKRTVEDKLKVLPSRKEDHAGKPQDPTPSQAEQLQREIDAIMGSVKDAVEAGDEANLYKKEAREAAEEAAESATEAKVCKDRAEAAVGKTSYIGDNGNWYEWSAETNSFVDTGVKAQAGSMVYVGATPPDNADVWVNPEEEYNGVYENLEKELEELHGRVESGYVGIKGETVNVAVRNSTTETTEMIVVEETNEDSIIISFGEHETAIILEYSEPEELIFIQLFSESNNCFARIRKPVDSQIRVDREFEGTKVAYLELVHSTIGNKIKVTHESQPSIAAELNYTVRQEISGKANKADTYTKDEVENKFGEIIEKIIDPDNNPIEETEDNIFAIDMELGGINHRTGENTDRDDAIRSTEYLPVSSGDIVYFENSIPAGSEVLRVICYDADKNFVETLWVDCKEEISISSKWKYLRFYRSDTADAEMVASMVVMGSTVKAEFEKIYLKDSGYYIKPDIIDDETMHKLKIGSDGEDDNEYAIVEICAPRENAAEATLCLMNKDENNLQFVDFSSMIYDPDNPTMEIVGQTRGGHKLPEFSIRFNDGRGAGRVKKFAVHPDCIPVELTSSGIKVRKSNAFNNNGTDDEYLTVNFEELMYIVRSLSECTARLESVKADMPAVINIGDTSYNFQFANLDNCVIRMGEAEEISFTFGNGEYPTLYMSNLSFDSGATPTAIDYTDSGILNWIGTDCAMVDGLSIFQPSANTHYDIVFYFNGSQFIGLVNGFVPSVSR